MRSRGHANSSALPKDIENGKRTYRERTSMLGIVGPGAKLSRNDGYRPIAGGRTGRQLNFPDRLVCIGRLCNGRHLARPHVRGSNSTIHTEIGILRSDNPPLARWAVKLDFRRRFNGAFSKECRDVQVGVLNLIGGLGHCRRRFPCDFERFDSPKGVALFLAWIAG